MLKRLQKFLLILLTVSLAAAPLRSSWATPDIPATTPESHCAQLALQDTQSNNTDTKKCETGCDGSCCEGSCSSCIPASSAISAGLSLLPPVKTTSHQRISRVEFSGRSVIPLLRPPATL
ncbi:hypothetical protein N9235_00455 [Gammaproteobacteria bacterium]|nr:hypothetical protein [Gammaproteobacteria bacterium]